MSTDRRSRPRALLVPGVTAIVVVGALAGCSGQGGAGASAAPTVTATASAPASTAPASASTPAGTTPGTSASASPGESSSPTAGCSTGDLTGTLASDGAAAGSTYLDLSLRNTGSQPCTLQGWPGVSFIDSSGKQIGAAADFDRSTSHATVTLMPDGHAVARLQVATAGDYPSAKCDEVQAPRLRVYPPGSTASLTITPSGSIATCADSSSHVLRVGALHASS